MGSLFGGGSSSADRASEIQAREAEKFSQDQQKHYDEYFLPIEDSLLDPRDYNVGKNIRDNMADFGQAKTEYQQAGQEQQNRFLGSVGMAQKSEMRSDRQNSVLGNQKILDATMESAIRHGIRSGTASDISMRRQEMLNLGKGYQTNMMQSLSSNAALAQQQDQFGQQMRQGQGAMIGAGLGLGSSFAGFYDQRPSGGGIASGGGAGAGNAASSLGGGGLGGNLGGTGVNNSPGYMDFGSSTPKYGEY